VGAPRLSHGVQIKSQLNKTAPGIASLFRGAGQNERQQQKELS
jgi:hypothetical protein